MKTPTHRNAVWLRSLYVGASEIKRNDRGLAAHEVEAQMEALTQSVRERFAADFVLHTGGHRLAATGSGDFMQRYSARRAALSKGSFRTVAVDEVVADDDYGVVTGRFEVRRGGARVSIVGMGAWRFSDGVAVEHWEMPDGQLWDDFFLAADPTLIDGNAEEYWSRPV